MSEKCQSAVGCRGYSRGMQSSPATAPHAPSSPAHLKRIYSPIGRIELTSDGAAVTSLAVEREGSLPWQTLPENSVSVLEEAARQLAEYFAGKRRDFDVPVHVRGTEFQRSVWSELGEIAFGHVLSYGEIGMATGRPAAGRAVGGAVGANPIPIIVPCHRVLGSDGRITGYSAGDGIPTKVWLLDHEGIAHR